MNKLNKIHIALIISTFACVVLTIIIAAFTNNINLIRICLLIDFIGLGVFFIVHDIWERKQKKENKIKTYKKIENILTYIFYVTGLISVFVSCIFMILNPPLSYIIFYGLISIVLVSLVGLICFDNLIKKT